MVFLVILSQFIARQWIREALIFLSISCFISYLLLYLFSPKYKRFELEQKKLDPATSDDDRILEVDSDVSNIKLGDDKFNIDSQDNIDMSSESGTDTF